MSRNYARTLESETPFATIIVPTLNEEEHIARCLEAIIGVSYPSNLYEVIVVDNGSTDRTVDKIRDYPVTLIECPGLRVGAVRNAGVARAKGEVIGFVDGDCVVPKDWLNAGISALSDGSVGAVGGDCILPEVTTWVEDAWVLQRKPLSGSEHLLRGGSILITRAVFLQAGGFDEAISAGEDTDLTRRVRSIGFNTQLIEGCAVVHLGYPKDLYYFTKRQVWHSSNALSKANIASADKTLILTMLFISSIFLTIVSVFFSGELALYGLILSLLCPLILSVKRLKRSGWPLVSVFKLVQVYVLDVFYLIGRSVGTMRSFLALLGVIDREKTYY